MIGKMTIARGRSVVILALIGLFVCSGCHQAHGFGVIKDLFQKITNTNNKTEDIVKQSAPICGSGLFSTPNESHLSPEIIFITSRPSRSVGTHSSGHNHNHNNHNNHNHNTQHGHGNQHTNHGSGNHNGFNENHGKNYQRENSDDQLQERRRDPASSSNSIKEVAKEFRFHTENVTIEELEQYGFNRDAPVSFLMHGFTSGYPLQAWISAIVEAYTIDRQSDQSSRRNDHNLFIVNWNYAARGILYPRAVANIPIVASYVTKFINDKLIDEARVDPRHIQLVGHSLGAHLAGFVGKNTRSKLGRIYGLDPAGPCFGALTGPLYPSSKRLAPSDANEVISIHTNSALLGIDKALGRYSVFVEGGEVQPGCKGGGPLASLGTLTWDGGDFDSVACSHSRAPNLLTYRHSQTSTEDDCQLVAYACKDWRSFSEGHCGVCASSGRDTNNYSSRNKRAGRNNQDDPTSSVECLLIGLDWQYPGSSGADSGRHQGANVGLGGHQSQKNTDYDSSESSHQNNDSNNYDRETYNSHHSSSTRRPNYASGDGQQSDYVGGDNNYRDREGSNYNGGNKLSGGSRRNTNERDNSGWTRERNRRNASQSSSEERPPSETTSTRSLLGGRDSVEAIKLFMRTADTQPYCTFHYQIVLELNEPFKGRGKPPMSIILQDSRPDTGQAGHRQRDGQQQQQQQQNSLSSDEFGNKFNERVYTHLMTSSKKLKRVDHATMIFRNGLEAGHRVFKALHVNYMSHSDPQVRRRLSSRLCPIKTDTDRGVSSQAGNRFYFEPCDGHSTLADSGSSNGNYGGSNQHNAGHHDSHDTGHTSGHQSDRGPNNHGHQNHGHSSSSSNYGNGGSQHSNNYQNN